jgi:hypothetical protein
MHFSLFSPNLSERLAATHSEHNSDKTLPWPCYCRGSANAYVIFLGPSRGKADSGEDTTANLSHHPKIGDGFGYNEFSDHKQRNYKWRALYKAALHNGAIDVDLAYKKLTAIWNLSSEHTSTEPSLERFITHSSLIEASRELFPLIAWTKPRIIITLTKNVSQLFSMMISVSEIPIESIQQTPPEIDGSRAYEVSFPGVGFKTLVFKTPQHPSRLPLNNKQTEAIHELVSRYHNG